MKVIWGWPGKPQRYEVQMYHSGKWMHDEWHRWRWVALLHAVLHFDRYSIRVIDHRRDRQEVAG